MNLEKANELVVDYCEWYKYSFSISIIAGEEWKVIQTPFLFTNRDLIDIHVRQTETQIELSDDGSALVEIELAGVSLEDPKLIRILTEQMNGSGVFLGGENKNELRKLCTAETFPRAFHEFIQCILALDALSVVNRLR